jgi:hypothetical protein
VNESHHPPPKCITSKTTAKTKKLWKEAFFIWEFPAQCNFNANTVMHKIPGLLTVCRFFSKHVVLTASVGR